METTLPIALAQAEGSADPAANLAKAAMLARRAADRGAKMIVFPEMFMGAARGGPTAGGHRRLRRRAFGDGLVAVATETGLFVVCGCWEPGSDRSRVYNTARIVSPSGKTVALYRKLHLFDALSVRESDTMVSGDVPSPIVEVAGVRTGLAICYDLRFAEVFRDLAALGAQLIVVPRHGTRGR